MQLEAQRSSIEAMYRSMHSSNRESNMPEYQPEREYIDPKLLKEQLKKQKQNYQRKQKQAKKSFGKKTFFIDETIQPFKINPAPGKYQIKSSFNPENNKNSSPNCQINLKAIKNTYIDQIQSGFKKCKTPGVGKYKLQKGIDEIQQEKQRLGRRRQSFEEKRYFHDEHTSHSIEVPGSGSYNLTCRSFFSAQKTKRVAQDRKFWIKKHKTENATYQKRQRVKPSPLSYRPLNATIDTFERIEKDLKLNEKTRKKRAKTLNGFGSSDAKFEYTRQKKSKRVELKPSPQDYKTQNHWIGKTDKKGKPSFLRSLSVGFRNSVYH